MSSTAAISCSSRIGGGVRQQRDGARPLDRERQLALVPGAVAGDAARDDLAALAQEAAEDARVLVVDQHLLVGAEAAHLAAAHATPAEAATLGLRPALAPVPHRAYLISGEPFVGHFHAL